MRAGRPHDSRRDGGATQLARREQVAQLFFFGLEIVFGMGFGSDFAGHALGHHDPAFFQRRYLVGIIRQQTHPCDGKRLQDFCWKYKFPMVGFEPEAFIGLDRVQSLVL